MGEWTTFALHASARKIWVDTTGNGGSDSNTGLTEGSPKATVAAGKALVRDGSGDWLQIRAGTQFDESLGTWTALDGLDADHPSLVTTWEPGGLSGGGSRYILRTGNSNGIGIFSGGCNFLAITNGELYPHTRIVSDNPSGISIVASGGGNLLLENMYFHDYKDNIVIIGFSGIFGPFRINRCIVAYAYMDSSAHSQGAYIEQHSTGCEIDECVFDHNGWNDGVSGADATIFNHNIYCQYNSNPITVKNCILTRGSSHGIQARSGATMQNNFFCKNPINILVGEADIGVASVSATLTDIVVHDGADTAANGRGWAFDIVHCTSVAVSKMIICNRTNGSAPDGISLLGGSGGGTSCLNVTFDQLIIYNWQTEGIGISGTSAQVSGFSLTNSDIQEPSPFTGRLVAVNNATAHTTFGTLSGNRYWRQDGSSSTKMLIAGSNSTVATFNSTVSDATSSETQVTYPNADGATIEDYSSAVGGAGTFADFISKAKANSKASWDDNYAGPAVVTWFQQQFGMAPVVNLSNWFWA